jgi:hypothetical protein
MVDRDKTAGRDALSLSRTLTLYLCVTYCTASDYMGDAVCHGTDILRITTYPTRRDVDTQIIMHVWGIR